LHNENGLHLHTYYIELHFLQLLDFHNASVLHLLHRPFFELNFVNHSMLDAFLHQLLTVFFLKQPVLNFFAFKHSMFDFLLLHLDEHSMLDFLLLFKPMSTNIAEAKLESMLLCYDVDRITDQTNRNHLPNSADWPLDNCGLHYTCQKSDQTSYTYTFTSVVATRVLTVTTGCSSCVGGSTSTLLYVNSTGSGPLSSAIQTTSPAGAMQTSVSGGSPSSVPSAPAAVPSAGNSVPSGQTSTSTVGITITVSKAGSESTQTVASATNVVESSSVIPVPQESAQTSAIGVQSAGTASRNMEVPSVDTANAVAPSAPSDMASPSAPMLSQSTVTIPVTKFTTICTLSDLTAAQPSMSAASSPAAPMSPASPMSSPEAVSSPTPPASNNMSPSAPANAPSSPATMAASTGMSSPASPESMGAGSASAQMSSPSAAMASEQPPSPTMMPTQESMPAQESMSAQTSMPAQESMPSESSMPSQPAMPAQSNSPSASDMSMQGSAPAQSGQSMQPSSPSQSLASPEASSPSNSNSTLSYHPPQSSSPPSRTGNGSSGSATKPNMPSATDTNMSSGSIHEAKASVFTVAASMLMAVAMIML
ncbi:hypothetical protein KCU65_g5416, partial [Aureobasidium melanogenum]